MTLLTGLMRLGADAEIRYTQEGEPVATLALAYNYGRKGEDGKRPVTWVRAALWGKRAEALAHHLKKGGQVVATVQDLHIENWEKRDGTKGASLAGRILEIELAGSAEARPAPAPKPQPRPAAKPATSFDDMPDDIPY